MAAETKDVKDSTEASPSDTDSESVGSEPVIEQEPMTTASA